jgi:hypothetical protein
MDKIKEKLHIGSSRKSQPENDGHATTSTSHSTTFNEGPGHNTAAAPSHGHTTGNTIEDSYGTLMLKSFWHIHHAHDHDIQLTHCRGPWQLR